MSGNRAEAMLQSRKARMWNIAGIVIGIVVYVSVITMTAIINIVIATD